MSKEIKNLFLQLPNDIIEIIQRYIYINKKWIKTIIYVSYYDNITNKKIVNYNIKNNQSLNDINNFFNISKEISKLKYDYLDFIFNINYSLKYLCNKNFNEEIKKKIDITKKLCLKFENNNYIEDVSPLCNVNTIKFKCCNNIKDVSPLCNVTNLTFNNCKSINDVGSLVNVKYLDLWCCNNITGISNLGNVKVDGF